MADNATRNRLPTLPIDPSEPAIVRLASWLTALDGWATYYETDPAAGGRQAREPMEAREYAKALYLLKEQALRVLSQADSPTISLSVLSGPAKAASVWLCDRCLRHAKAARMAAREYAELSGGCPQCQREEGDNDYYSLYVLSVDYGPLGMWRFHTPVPVGRGYLPAPGSAASPVVGKRPIEHGRPKRIGVALSASERKAYREPEVVYQVWQALRDVRRNPE